MIKGECEYCGVYTVSCEEIHEESYTHLYWVNKMKAEKTEQEIRGIKQMMAGGREHECICSVCPIKGCDFEGTREEVLAHEKECLQFENHPEVETRKFISSKTATCPCCERVFHHTSKTLTPLAAMNRHFKTCEKSMKKKLKIKLREEINDCNSFNTLKKIEELLNQK